MKRLLLVLAALAVLGCGARGALAGDGYYGYGGYQYWGRGAYYGRQPYHGPPAAGYYFAPSNPRFESHEEAVARIMAAHSRYRYNPHPRAIPKAPPYPVDYWGW